jgi:hypothetical protein
MNGRRLIHTEPNTKEINNMKFEVKNRFSGELQFTAEIECDKKESTSIKLRLAVQWAIYSGAYLSGADLSGADLSGADLSGSKNIYSFGPIGKELRIGFAIKKDKEITIKLGCFEGTEKEAIAAIKKKYGRTSTYADQIKLAVKILKEQK